MIGLILALFLSLILIGLGKQWPDVYRKSTALLFWWNMLITGLLVSIWPTGTVFIASLGGMVAGTAGFLIALAGGGLALSTILLFMIVMSAVQTIGALFIHKALVETESNVYNFNRATLVAGVILFIFGLSRVFG